VTLGEFLEILSASYVIGITRDADGSVIIDCDHGYRDRTVSIIPGPIADTDVLDPEVAKTVCRELRVSTDILGP
jgi:hypothetical protein